MLINTFYYTLMNESMDHECLEAIFISVHWHTKNYIDSVIIYKLVK
jgi:hypothetical protein